MECNFGLKSYAWFQNRKSAQCEFDLKSQVWYQTKIARPEVQLPLYKIHFEIVQLILMAQIHELQEFAQYQYLLNQVAKFAKQWLFSFIFLQCDWLV